MNHLRQQQNNILMSEIRAFAGFEVITKSYFRYITVVGFGLLFFTRQSQ